jgi:hypothetical protein
MTLFSWQPSFNAIGLASSPGPVQSIERGRSNQIFAIILLIANRFSGDTGLQI